MSFGQSLARRFFTEKTEEPAAPEQRLIAPFGPWPPYGQTAASGVTVSNESATQLLAVYGCVQLISDTICTLPLDVYRDASDGTPEEVSNTPRWLKRPNPTTTFLEFINQTLVSLLLDGNAYWVYNVDGNGLPNELHVIDPTVVDVRAASEAVGAEITYRIRGVIYRGKLVHIKGITRPGALKGMSPIESARQAIGSGIAAQEYAARFYANGASLSGVIQAPNQVTLEQARDIVNKFSAGHAGLRNAHKPGLLDNGAEWKPLSVTPEQAQFLETRSFTSAEICSQLFLVSPSWFGVSSGRGTNITYQNLEQDGERFAQFTCARWVVRLERAISDLLPQPQYACFDMDELYRGSLSDRAAYYTAALNPQTGWMNRAEVREEEKLGRDLPTQQVPFMQPAPVVSIAPAPNASPAAAAN